MTAILFVIPAMAGQSLAQMNGWQHTGSMYILTTPEGANLPAAAVVEDFPLLVRLDKDFFDFAQAKADGADIRFSTAAATPIPYQIEEWDAAKGSAIIWLRIPKITGNSRQEIKMHWGNATAKSESRGDAVFNKSNGYLSVWHMDDIVKDVVGTLESKDTGTTSTPGIIGAAKHFPGQKGVFCGDKITSYPVGAASHSTEAWFRTGKPNATIIGWGNEGGGRGSKIRMQLRSPPHIHIDSDFSDVRGTETVTMGEWVHVVHTYDKDGGKLYLNGKLDAAAKPILNIKSPARLWIGGWYNNYDFVGDIDEVRISQVARSPEWIRLQYENQRALQTVVGPLVQAGNGFSVSQAKIAMAEGKAVTITAKAGGALKTYWLVKSDGVERVVAADRNSFTFNAGRVVGDKQVAIQFKAIYANEVKTQDIAVTIHEAIPEPVFKLQAPSTWDGRQTIEIVPQISNVNEMQVSGAGKLQYEWSVSDIAVIQEILPGKLILKRAQNSGTVTVRARIDNGGKPTVQTVTMAVKEPARDPWVVRVPGKEEMPEEGQFCPRDEKNEGTLFCTGALADAVDTVYMKLYADDNLVDTVTRKPEQDKSYQISVKLKAGLVKYKIEFGTRVGQTETVLHTAGNIVCGDVYLINGQSNADATDVGKEDPKFSSEWIRSFGSMASDPNGSRLKRWGTAVVRDRNGGKFQIGYWGMELARRLMESQKMPICIVNGAIGGTRIDAHQRNNDDPTDIKSLYGRLLWRVQQARLTHGVRAILWHQGENDQGADGPTGGYGYQTYQQYFMDLAAGWKQDYPNVRNYYVFQIWPRACSMGINGSDNRLREVQRTLPRLFSNLHVMSTLGIKPPGGCHYPAEGYAEFARLIAPLVERDQYGKTSTTSITAPNLKQTYFSSGKKDEVVLVFDQHVKWDNALTSQFYLDGQKAKVASGSAAGNVVKLKLHAATPPKTITYLDSAAWSQDKLLYGENGIAALTFCEVEIATSP